MAEANRVASLKDVVGKLLADIEGPAGRGKRLSKEQIGALWKNAAGARAARRSRPTSLRKGRLVVMVEDSSLLYDLTVRKKEILAGLAKELPDTVRELQFRIGDIGEEEQRDQRKSKKVRRGR